MTREMGSLPEPVKAFNDELAEMLTQKPPVSSSKMKDITRNAMKAQKYYKHIVMSVEKLVQKCKPEYKLSGIYVIDAIVRQSRHQNKEKDVYAGRFESNLHITATHLFKCSRTDQVKICRTFKLWELNKVFSYHSIQKCLNNANPEARKEGVGLAEKSIAKMAIKPVATPDIVKQQKELEEQRRKIKEQQEELKRKQEALLKQNSSSIPPILGKLLHFGQPKENAVPDDNVRASETANKVKSLLDDFDYSDEDDIKQPGKKGTPKSKSTPPPSIPTPKKTENLSTPSPVTTTHDTSLYQPDPPPKELSASKPVDKYDTRNLEKLYTPSPIDKPGKRSKHKSPERNKKSHKSEKRDSHSERPRDRSQDKSRDKSRERSRERSRDKSSRRRSSPEARRSSKSGGRSGKRSRSTSPGHYSRKRDRNSKPDCVSVLSTTIWIGNLRKTVTKSDISSLMKKYTESCSIDMVPPRGCSYINVNDRDVAENVLKELLKENLKLHGALCKVAWAPGKGCKEFKEHWNIEKGVTFIPHKNFEKLKISELEDGGVIEETTLPQGFKLQDAKEEEERQAKRKQHAPLMSLSIPPSMAVFSMNPNIKIPTEIESNSDEEMMDVFPPIPILPVPTVPDSAPDGSVPFPMPGMTPLAPHGVPGWMPPRPAPPGQFQGMAPPFSLPPPPHHIPLPNMANMLPPSNMPNLNQIPLPSPQMPVLPGPMPLPGPRFGAPTLGPAQPVPVSEPTPLFRFRRSPSPPSPRTLARNMMDSDNESDSEPNRSKRNEMYPGGLPPFRKSSSPKNNIYLTGGISSSPSSMESASNARIHAGSLPPFNSSVPISRTVPSPSKARPGEPTFVNQMRATSPRRPQPSSPGIPRFNNQNQYSPSDPSPGEPTFVNSMRSASPQHTQPSSPGIPMFNNQNQYSPIDPRSGEPRYVNSMRSVPPRHAQPSSPGIPRFNNQNQYSLSDPKPLFLDEENGERPVRPRPPGDPQNFPGPDSDRNSSSIRPSLEEMRGPVQHRPNFAALENMARFENMAFSSDHANSGPRFSSDHANSGPRPGTYRGGAPRAQFGRPPPPQFGGMRGPAPRGNGPARPRFNGPPGPRPMGQRGPFRMTFRPRGNNRPPFGH
ncbi:SR-related and CTD-associated factor 4-like isoform X2 [Bolinopsis microptera]|uniref:SR-related and CTD-associated factor 4-like isoform X2 n=1 Tax=Bolinopsis microptera TaxID=2820187 RepID=UPI0030792FF1